MSIVIASLIGIGTKLLTSKVIEASLIALAEVLVKRTSSKADDRLLEIVKLALK